MKLKKRKAPDFYGVTVKEINRPKISFKKIFFIAVILGFAACILVFGLNLYVVLSTKNQIKTEFKDSFDCILVLGAGVRDGQPRPMLQDRLDYAIELYKNGAAPKLIMSGDHGRKDYDEVNIMKQYAIDRGVPSEDIFMDHAGFSTYESVYRAEYIFKVKSMIIVTQKYHLFRALYISEKLGIKAEGYASDPRSYTGGLYRELREVLARDKDVFYCIFKPRPTYLGDAIPVNGNGNLTND